MPDAKKITRGVPRKARKMTKAAADRIAVLYETRGWSIRRIMADPKVGYSYGAVRNVLVARKVPLRRRGRTKTNP